MNFIEVITLNGCYRFKIFYVNLIVTTKENTVVITTPKNMISQSTLIQKDINTHTHTHPTIKNNEQWIQKITRKQLTSGNNKSSLINITLSISGSHYLIRKHRMTAKYII